MQTCDEKRAAWGDTRKIEFREKWRRFRREQCKYNTEESLKLEQRIKKTQDIMLLESIDEDLNTQNQVILNLIAEIENKNIGLKLEEEILKYINNLKSRFYDLGYQKRKIEEMF